MLRASARTNSLAASLLVHGAALGAALVWVAGMPKRSGQRTLEVAVIAPASAPYEPVQEVPEELTLPEEPDEPPPVPDVAEATVDQPLDPPPWLEPPPEGPRPTSDEADPFRELPLETDLRVVRVEPPIDPPVAPEVTPPPTPLPPAEAAPEPPAAAQPAPSAPSPLPGATPLPDYPDSWARRGWVGEVTVELDVAADGRVTAARVAQSSGFARLDELARSTLETWRFAPATAGGVAVPSTFRQRVEFRARD